MSDARLTSLSSLDGRYCKETEELWKYFSEFALMKARLEVKVKWLKTVLGITDPHHELNNIVSSFDLIEARQIKVLEVSSDHDVKAVEVYLKHTIDNRGITYLQKPIKTEMLHFGCTSDDVDNLAYALLIKRSQNLVTLPVINMILAKLRTLAHDYSSCAMVARTHGQPASPTTFGKEMAVFVSRMQDQIEQLLLSKNNAKFNGATGNLSAWASSNLTENWLRTSENFVHSFDLDYKKLTTQIEPQDGMVIKFDIMRHLNNILIDLCRDLWSYISLGYLGQKRTDEEVGSSTMPHKVNPIKFENAEGNLGLANALFYHFSEVLTKSRMQRDLTNSTVRRNIGAAFGYSLVAYKNLLKGLNKIEVNKEAMDKDLDEHWEVLTEAIQTTMRFHGLENAYDIVKNLSHGRKLSKKDIHDIIDSVDIPTNEKIRLKNLTPGSYIGYAPRLALSC